MPNTSGFRHQHDFVVEMILELLARGATVEEILEDYPQLEEDDIQAALFYAHRMVAGETILERVAA